MDIEALTLLAHTSSCVCLSVLPSATSRCSTETAKRRIMPITPHDTTGTLVCCCQRSRRNTNGVTPNRGAKRWATLNAGAIAACWRRSTRSVVNLARSQVYHTERPPSLFAARRAGLSATADPCLSRWGGKLRVEDIVGSLRFVTWLVS